MLFSVLFTVKTTHPDVSTGLKVEKPCKILEYAVTQLDVIVIWVWMFDMFQVREVARVFSATTTKETAGQPQEKQPLSQVQHGSTSLSSQLCFHTILTCLFVTFLGYDKPTVQQQLHDLLWSWTSSYVAGEAFSSTVFSHHSRASYHPAEGEGSLQQR